MSKIQNSKTLAVGLIMGSQSDWECMRPAANRLKSMGVSFEALVVSAHRSPEKMYQYAREASDRGVQVIIAGAGGAAHLPGMVAALTTLPVIGVPVPSRHLAGQDSLLSIVQMPAGVPVATVGIGASENAALLAIRILALQDGKLAKELSNFKESQTRKVQNMKLPLKSTPKKSAKRTNKS